MRALIVLCLAAGVAHAELPTIDTEFPPTLRIEASAWGVRFDLVEVELHSAPAPSFVKLAISGRERTLEIALDVPTGTQIIGLGADGVSGSAWGRAMPVNTVRDREQISAASMRWESSSADQDHVRVVARVPTTIELAMFLPPIPRLAVTAPGPLAVSVENERVATNKHKRVVVELADVAGTTGDIALAAIGEHVGLVADPASPSDFLEFPASNGHSFRMRDLDKSMIRRRMKWLRPQLRQCFMQTAQWSSLRGGGAVVSFMILASGEIDWATISESDLPATVTDCLVAQVKSLVFPATDGNVQVNYPIEFRAVE